MSNGEAKGTIEAENPGEGWNLLENKQKEFGPGYVGLKILTDILNKQKQGLEDREGSQGHNINL